MFCIKSKSREKERKITSNFWNKYVKCRVRIHHVKRLLARIMADIFAEIYERPILSLVGSMRRMKISSRLYVTDWPLEMLFFRSSVINLIEILVKIDFNVPIFPLMI